MICQQIKAEHQNPENLLHPLPIPSWKWDKFAKDFVSGLSRTPNNYDTIWVVIYRMTRITHFISIRMDFKLGTLSGCYINRIVSLYVVPTSIVSN